MLQTDIAVWGEHSPCSGHTGFAPHRGVCAFPVYTAQAPGCSIWSGPCVECGSSFPVLHKSADSVAPAFCVSPASAAQAARGLGALSPDAAHLFPLRRVARAARGLGALSPGAARLFKCCFLYFISFSFSSKKCDNNSNIILSQKISTVSLFIYFFSFPNCIFVFLYSSISLFPLQLK